VNIIDKTESKAAIDFERYRLRRFLAELPREEIETSAEPIDLAAVAQALDGNPRAVHFHAVGPERQELAGNVTGSRSRIAHAFGVAADELLQEVRARLANSPSIVEVSRAEAPAQEIVLTGSDADLTT
jgi:3-polyprenyl-4-hydroxybenzoate decarboxylase